MTATGAGTGSGVRRRFPGWRVVGAVFVMLMTSAGLGFYGLGVYLEAISDERGFSVASLSLATTLFFTVGGLVGVVVARLIARHDPRPVVVAGGVIGGVALALLGRAAEIWQVYVLYAVFAVGFAAAGLVPGTTVVTRWFHRRRSVALSVASTGLSVGGLLLTPLASRFIDRQGFEAATPWLGLAFLVGVVPVTLLFLRPDPAALGFLPDGDEAPPVSSGPPALPPGVAFTDAVRTRFFVGNTVGYVLVMAAQVGGIAHLFKLVSERVDRSSAALAVLLLASASVVARLIGGVLVTRVPMVGATAALAVLQGGSLVLLARADPRIALLGGAVVFGTTVGNLLMLQPLLIAERFGVFDYARIFSRAQLLTTIGVAGGPLLIGWVHDNAGGYATAYVIGGMASVAGAVAIALGGSVRSPVAAVSLSR